MLNSLIGRLLAVAIASAAATSASADVFPSKPVSMVVQFSAGGGTDNIARLIAPAMSQSLGQPVVIENKPGAGGNIGTELVARAKPDGHTILLGNVSPHVINPHTYPAMAVDPMKELTPVGLISQGPLVFIVDAALPVKTFAEFVAYVKARPGKVNYASTGTGGITHIATELLKTKAGLEMTHVPYKGTAQALQDLLGGHVQAMSDGLGSAMPQIKAGKVRALLLTGATRSAAMPDLPTATELGVPDYAFYGWLGLFAPVNTPPAVVATLRKALEAGLRDERFQSTVKSNGGEPGNRSSMSDFAKQVQDDYQRWGAVARTANIKAGD